VSQSLEVVFSEWSQLSVRSKVRKVRSEERERAIYIYVQNNYRYYRRQTLVLPTLRSERWKVSYSHQGSAQNWPVGTTELEPVLSASVGTIGKRLVLPTGQFCAPHSLRKFGLSVLSTHVGTTSPTPVPPVVHFCATFRRRLEQSFDLPVSPTKTVGTTGAP